MSQSSGRSPDLIADDLADEILSGRLGAGEKLSSERQLALHYEASRPIVREALRTLVERGLVEVVAARGTFVRSDPDMSQLRPLDLHYRRRGTTARQLSEARSMLEQEAVALAAERADAADIARLEGALERVEHSRTPLDRVRYDLGFHLALVAASHNPVIEAMFASIASLAVELMVRSVGDPEVVRRSEPFHRIAFEAVRRRDAAAARAAIHAHLRVASETYGLDFDRSLDTTAARALRMVGSAAGLDEFVRSVLPDHDTPGS
ncbi:MAG: FadR family transcriptional regulator [Chloroflexi bacterium]|nr:FadR family transcriptional regulator [Chloroflexota bacterium]